MDPRRGGRPSQVRPRPSTLGRPVPVKARATVPSPTRLARYRRIDRRRGLPVPVGLALAVAVVALGFGILWVGSGAVGPVVSAVVSGFGSFVNRVGSVVSSPPPTPAADVSDAPGILGPEDAYTNDDEIDVTVTVPASVVGSPEYTVRLWVTLKDEDRQLVAEAPVGPIAVQVIPNVDLSPGRNDFQASIAGPAGESELSSIATWVLDTSKPKLTIISPEDGSSTDKDAITVKGKTQARSTVRLRNDINGATVTVDADKDGLFSARIPLAAGMNAVLVTSTDPAGNPNEASVTIRKGSGKLTADLTASAYRFRANRLPRTVSFSVDVTGADGRPVRGAVALFTVSVPGLEAIVSNEIATGRDGTATFTTSIPRGAMPGSGLATVLVTTDRYGDITDRQVLTVR